MTFPDSFSNNYHICIFTNFIPILKKGSEDLIHNNNDTKCQKYTNKKYGESTSKTQGPKNTRYIKRFTVFLKQTGKAKDIQMSKLTYEFIKRAYEINGIPINPSEVIL